MRQPVEPCARHFVCTGACACLHLASAPQVTSAGAEVLPFLASCGVLPASLGFFFFYGRLVERLPPSQIFYAAIAPLVAFYVAFAAFLYPAAPVLHPTGLAVALGPHLPVGFAGLLKVGVPANFRLTLSFNATCSMHGMHGRSSVFLAVPLSVT